MKKKEKTPEPQIDESLLTPEQKEALKPQKKTGWIVFFSVIFGLMLICLIVILAL